MASCELPIFLGSIGSDNNTIYIYIYNTNKRQFTLVLFVLVYNADMAVLVLPAVCSRIGKREAAGLVIERNGR